MLHNTPQVNTPWGWYIHPPCTISYCATGWPPVALILTRRLLEDFPQRKWWWICKPEALMVTVWGTWNLRAQLKVGFTVATDLRFGQDTQEKFSSWETNGGYPNTIALVKAPARGLPVPVWMRTMGKKFVRLSQREYVSTNVDYIHLGDPNSYVCSSEQHMRMPTCFMEKGVNSRTEQLWHMTHGFVGVAASQNWLEILERVSGECVQHSGARTGAA